MRRRKRTYYTDTQKLLMWDRWQQGQSLHQIASLFGRHHSSVRNILAEHGGNRPPVWRRSARALRLAEREETSRGLAAGWSIHAIATSLGRAPSTISREIGRNEGREGYRASQADHAAWDRAQRPKRCKVALHRALAARVAEKIQRQWSPEQVAGWLKRTYPDDASRQVSHETIYRTFYIQSRGALKQELLAHLRRTRAMRRSRQHTQKTESHGRITDTVSINERPANAKDRAVLGHWEGDLLFGDRNSQIATLVERQTRYLMLVKVAGKDAETVVNALIKNARRLPRQLYRSLTWDRAKEMAGHGRYTLATDIQVYFCDLAPSLATRQQREHQRPIAAVLLQGHQSCRCHAGEAGCGGTTAQCTATQDAGLLNTSRAISTNCCVDRLNPRPEAVVGRSQ